MVDNSAVMTIMIADNNNKQWQNGDDAVTNGKNVEQ